MTIGLSQLLSCRCVNPQEPDLDHLEREECRELVVACQIEVLTPVSPGKRYAIFSNNLN